MKHVRLHKVVSVACLLLTATLWSAAARAQRKVDAMIDLVSSELDSLRIGRGKNFVVQLPVRARLGDDWKPQAATNRVKLGETILGEAGTLPNLQEPKLFFYRAADKGADTLRFTYVNPKAAAGDSLVVRRVYILVQ